MAAERPRTKKDSRPPLAPGTRVEVRSGFDDTWQQGFTVESVTEQGYALRRESDGEVLPEIDRDRVRRPRSRQTWWF